ncbi:uncharacterized protein LOC134282395 [Saccostrea cucullata]|uniref:uncharacterized protein LOC134282395 n=1 Tax=Saccostrea cuccullata TaxID=36930 RepID=UPI002ED1DA66
MDDMISEVTNMSGHEEKIKPTEPKQEGAISNTTEDKSNISVKGHDVILSISGKRTRSETKETEKITHVPVTWLQEIRSNMQKALQTFQGKAPEPQSILYDINVLSDLFVKKIGQLEEENTSYAIKLAALNSENENVKKECKTLKQDILKKNVEIQEAKSEHSINVGKYGTLKGEAKKEVQRLRKEMEELRHKLGHVNEEKNYWVRRISEIAGAKMTDGNAQITDLSDPNRPIKLAERFGELYDACWTDVLEEFMIHHSKGTAAEEKKAIDGLKTLLEDCHSAGLRSHLIILRTVCTCNLILIH